MSTVVALSNAAPSSESNKSVIRAITRPIPFSDSERLTTIQVFGYKTRHAHRETTSDSGFHSGLSRSAPVPPFSPGNRQELWNLSSHCSGPPFGYRAEGFSEEKEVPVPDALGIRSRTARGHPDCGYCGSRSSNPGPGEHRRCGSFAGAMGGDRILLIKGEGRQHDRRPHPRRRLCPGSASTIRQGRGDCRGADWRRGHGEALLQDCPGDLAEGGEPPIQRYRNLQRRCGGHRIPNYRRRVRGHAPYEEKITNEE